MPSKTFEAIFLLCLLPQTMAILLQNRTIPISFVTRALNPSSVTATILSEKSPISLVLFGRVSPTPAPPSAFQPNVHPRIVVSKTDWDALLSRYADDKTFNLDGSWSRYHRRYTLKKGPTSSFITATAGLMASGLTNRYKGTTTDLSVLSQSERAELFPLVEKATTMSEFNSGSFFICALWASVNRKRIIDLGESGRFLPATQIEKCVNATVAWATVMLAHRAYYCNPNCPTSSTGRGNLWLFTKRWEVQNDWYTGGMGMAMSYDVLYNDMSNAQRKTVRSAIALLVMKRWSWGNSETSDRVSPNAVKHPHRIFSNWAPYHSNLYLTNLAIEGETDYDMYSSAVLASQSETGFNKGLKTRFEAMIEAYMAHSFYPDGTTYEDGYSYFIALREGSLGLLAAHRRGIPILDTPRFQNLIHNAAQLYEPKRCGKLIGHASGGGNLFPASMALFRYAYPDGVLPNMLWRMRMGPDFKNNNPCRIEWHQNMVQLSILGGEHGSVTNAESMQGMSDTEKALIPLSFYGPRRGLLIARNTHSENSVLLHFDARPDCFYVGHDNADRGIFTFTALKKTWIDDLPWKENIDSRRHSLMHVDGLAQDEKAPCANMLKVKDEGKVVLASADLTYAYNVQWARNWPDSFPPTVYVTTYGLDGKSKKVTAKFTVKETGDPRNFGWPAGDKGGDLGLERPESNMHGDPDMGFLGMWTWKRDYRTKKIEWAVRSTALVRADEKKAPGYVLVTDSFKVTGKAGNHVFESYLILGSDVSVHSSSSFCSGNRCKVVLKSSSSNEQLDIHVLASGTSVSYRIEKFDGNTRVIIKSAGMQAEEFWMALNPHNGNDNGFGIVKIHSGGTQVAYQSEKVFFKVSGTTHDLEVTTDPTTPMAFLDFPLRDNLKVEANMFSSNKDSFLRSTSAPLQAVLKLPVVQPGDLVEMEANTQSEMAIYDCGYESISRDNYTKRKCSLMSESAATCQNSKIRQRLILGKPYFVAISVTPGAGVSPHVLAKHKEEL